MKGVSIIVKFYYTGTLSSFCTYRFNILMFLLQDDMEIRFTNFINELLTLYNDKNEEYLEAL
jgi:hypothetical protein